tara:strand:- start:132 stop:407 length:276 start_codon:yes stop_codon:yes gene_type:complete
MKKSYSIAIDGITELSQVNKQLNEETQGWDLKKAFDYKGKYKVQGKTLTNWMEKLWTIVEETGIEPIVEEYETEMIQYSIDNSQTLVKNRK